MSILSFESSVFTWQDGAYTISTDRDRLDVHALWEHFRAQAYWAADIEYLRFETSVKASLPFAAYAADGLLAGFCKVVTDGASVAYLRDVLVLEAHRGQGLGTALSRRALGHPDLACISYWLLRTLDAHKVYAKLGFTPLSDADTFMIRRTEKVDWSTD